MPSAFRKIEPLGSREGIGVGQSTIWEMRLQRECSRGSLYEHTTFSSPVSWNDYSYPGHQKEIWDSTRPGFRTWSSYQAFRQRKSSEVYYVRLQWYLIVCHEYNFFYWHVKADATLYRDPKSDFEGMYLHLCMAIVLSFIHPQSGNREDMWRWRKASWICWTRLIGRRNIMFEPPLDERPSR